ncbi:uncharacterized protein LAESUDRAFT_733136, partial [Laetiporus sulphureus 93-53]
TSWPRTTQTVVAPSDHSNEDHAPQSQRRPTRTTGLQDPRRAEDIALHAR